MIQHMPENEYRSRDELSYSDLKWLNISPQHFLERQNLKIETESMNLGTLVHMALLEPTRFKESYILEPKAYFDGTPINKRVKAHREFLKDFRESNLDKVIATEDQYEAITGMLTKLALNTNVRDLIVGGQKEIVSIFEHEDVPMRARADCLIEHPQLGLTVVDIKTTRDASNAGFSRSVFNYLYHLQAAVYLKAFDASEFVFIAIESEAPYGIGIYKADPSLVEIGQAKFDDLICKYKECMETDVWPSYTESIDNLTLPSWAASKLNEDKNV